ncbi:MAG: hypothetical protein ACOCY6_03165 [Halodesulfurarchaeum sp.]
MVHRNLVADVAPGVIFAIAAVVFALGWLDTDRTVFAIAALAVGVAAGYQFYRFHDLYLE